MKFFTLLFFFVVTNTYAGVCDLSYTFEIDEAIERGEMTQLDVVEDDFSALEKTLILKMVAETSGITNADEAMEVFLDRYMGGNIEYFMTKNQTLALVHFFPGDTEVGLIFVIEEDMATQIATINDSGIDCN